MRRVDSVPPNPPVSTLDPELLDQFLQELDESGFAPTDGGGRVWAGPLAPELAGFTSANEMRVVLRDGWPYHPPSVLVEGLRSWHANEGHLCLWQEGDDTRTWTTLHGIRQRIGTWVDDAESDFREFGTALDAHLYWEGRDPAVALINPQEIVHRARQDGHHAVFHAKVETEGVWLIGRDNGRGPGTLNGRWFYRDTVEYPPRCLDEFAETLTATQRRRFLKDVADIKPGSAWLAGLFWEIPEGTVALLVHVSRSAEGGLSAGAVTPTPRSTSDLLRRAGPDVARLSEMRVVVFGVGAIGSHVVALLARAGVGRLRLVDGDSLWPVDVVRHAAYPRNWGVPKPHAMHATLAHLHWVRVEPIHEATWDAARLAELMDGSDLVVEATGLTPFAELTSRVAARGHKAFVTSALYRGGAIARVRRQAEGDTLIVERAGHWRYPLIPAGHAEDEYVGFEVGCGAPIHNASPVAVARAAAAAAGVCVDQLTGRREYPDEVVEVYQSLEAPLDRVGTLTVGPHPPRVEVAEVAAGALRAAAASAAPNETGGVLIGRTIGGVPVVTTAVEMPTAKATPAGFQVEADATSPAVEAAVAEDPTVGYVGEWHSHPSDQPASATDRTTMLRLASAQGTGDPVLVILRPRGGGYELDAHVATGSDLHRIPVMTVGDIKPPDLAER